MVVAGVFNLGVVVVDVWWGQVQVAQYQVLGVVEVLLLLLLLLLVVVVVVVVVVVW